MTDDYPSTSIETLSLSDSSQMTDDYTSTSTNTVSLSDRNQMTDDYPSTSTDTVPAQNVSSNIHLELDINK